MDPAAPARPEEGEEGREMGGEQSAANPGATGLSSAATPVLGAGFGHQDCISCISFIAEPLPSVLFKVSLCLKKQDRGPAVTSSGASPLQHTQP